MDAFAIQPQVLYYMVNPYNSLVENLPLQLKALLEVNMKL